MKVENVRQFVNTVQEQPVKVRKTILVVTSFCVMAIIVIVWLATLSLSGKQNTTQASNTERPFKLVSDVISESYATAINGFKSSK